MKTSFHLLFRINSTCQILCGSDQTKENNSTLKHTQNTSRSSLTDSDGTRNSRSIDKNDEEGLLLLSNAATFNGACTLPDNCTLLSVSDPLSGYKLKRSKLQIFENIGQGRFSQVFRGKYDNSLSVAVKKFPAGSPPSALSELKLLEEARCLATLNKIPNNHVLRIIGIVEQNRPGQMFLVTELAAHGDLHSFLLRDGRRISVLALIEMAKDVSQGMEYLQSRGFIHRSLAARSVLVDHKRNCKIGAFGKTVHHHSQETKLSNINSRTRFDVRWASPETVFEGKFSFKSDVWSYGVCLWEILSLGEIPYWDMESVDILSSIKMGYRLPALENQPSELHQLMMCCWMWEADSRPSFKDIFKTLDLFIKNPALMGNCPNGETPTPLTDSLPETQLHNHSKRNSQNLQNLNSNQIKRTSSKIQHVAIPQESNPMVNSNSITTNSTFMNNASLMNNSVLNSSTINQSLNQSVSQSNNQSTFNFSSTQISPKSENSNFLPVLNKPPDSLESYLQENLKLPLIYCEKFRNHGIDNLQKMAKIENSDLVKMGIDIPMHKNKVRFGVESLRNLYGPCKPRCSPEHFSPRNVTSIKKIDSGLNGVNHNTNNNNSNNTAVTGRIHMGDATNELIFAINVSDSCYNGSASNSSNSEVIDC